MLDKSIWSQPISLVPHEPIWSLNVPEMLLYCLSSRTSKRPTYFQIMTNNIKLLELIAIDKMHNDAGLWVELKFKVTLTSNVPGYVIISVYTNYI